MATCHGTEEKDDKSRVSKTFDSSWPSPMLNAIKCTKKDYIQLAWRQLHAVLEHLLVLLLLTFHFKFQNLSEMPQIAKKSSFENHPKNKSHIACNCSFWIFRLPKFKIPKLYWTPGIWNKLKIVCCRWDIFEWFKNTMKNKCNSDKTDKNVRESSTDSFDKARRIYVKTYLFMWACTFFLLCLTLKKMAE